METTTAGKIGKYAIVREIAQGGFGKTLLAETAEGKRVVLKQFNPQQYNVSSQALRLFDQECDRLKEVGTHDQIPSFIEYFEEGGNKFLVQEFVDGQTLKDELKESGIFSEEQIISLLKDILPAIKFVHEKNVIHRDIKPENIIRRSIDGKLFLVDFGASKPVSDTVLAKTGTMIGSPLYVAPEQSRGKPKYASDIYSLGLTCAHLLTQVSPFDLVDEDEGRWIWQDYCTQAISEDLVLMINTMLKRGLKDRYKSASEVLEALENLARDEDSDLSPFVLKLKNAEDSWIREVAWKTLTEREIRWCSVDQQKLMTAGLIQIRFDLPAQEAEEFLLDKDLGNVDYADFIIDNREWKSGEVNWTHGSKPGSLAPTTRKVGTALVMAAVATITTGIAVRQFTSVPVAQEAPPVVEQPLTQSEDEGGFSLPRFPLIDDMRDELVADEVWPEGSMISIDHVFLLVKIIIVLNFGGMFLRVLLNFRIPRSISGSD